MTQTKPDVAHFLFAVSPALILGWQMLEFLKLLSRYSCHLRGI